MSGWRSTWPPGPPPAGLLRIVNIVYVPGMEEIGINAARPKLGDIVDRARFNNIPTVITREGKPAAVVVSVEFFEHALNARPRPRIRDTEGDQS